MSRVEKELDFNDAHSLLDIRKAQVEYYGGTSIQGNLLGQL